MPKRSQGRFLATVLFTDIAGSTVLASELGDRKWRDLLNAHHSIIRKELKRFGGTEMDTAGDGFFATFEQPTEAIDCACSIVEDVHELGVEIRAGIHVGEVEVIGQKVGGIAVHIGARVAAQAGPSEVLVSGTIKELMSGSDTRFEDRGVHELKGVEGGWHLYVVQQDTTDRSSRRVRRGRRLLPIVGSLAAAAVLLGIVVLLHHFGGGASDEGTAGVSSPAPLEMTAADTELLSLVPDAIQGSCQAALPNDPGADAALACISRTGLKDMHDEPDEYNVGYTHFGSRDDMDAAFEQGLHGVDIPAGGDCANDHAAVGSYSVGAKRVGRVACFQTKDGSGKYCCASGQSVIDWTDDRVLVYAVATRNELGDLPVYRWWVSSAGPVEPGSAVLTKDAQATRPGSASNGFPGFPNGTFVKTVPGDDTDAGQWRVVISGGDTEGKYREFRERNLPYENGFWALGKDDEFIIWSAGGGCADIGFGVYRFHLSEPAGGHVLARFDFISDACGWGGIPPGTSWNHGPPWTRVS